MNLFTTQNNKSQRTPKSPAAALRVQSSVAGTPRAIGWGQARMAGNLTNALGFTATPITSSVPGGKGGGGTFTSGYVYSVTLTIGLAEGPIAGIVQGWSDKSAESLADLGANIFLGGSEQAPWSYLTANYPVYAQNFRGLAYLGFANFDLGTSNALPNLTFEVRFAVSGAVTETTTVSSPYTFQSQYFDANANGATEMMTVPYAAPFEVLLANPQGLPYTLSGVVLPEVTGLASTGNFAAMGAFYTDTSPREFLTLVTGAPSAGQFQLGTGFYLNFAAADAGAAITIVDLAVSAGVNYAVSATGAVSAGVTLVALTASIVGDFGAASTGIGAPVAGDGIVNGTVIAALSGGTATANLSLGSVSVTVSAGTYSAFPGVAVSDGAGKLPAGTVVVSAGGPEYPTIQVNNNAAITLAGVSVFFSTAAVFGSIDGNVITFGSTPAAAIAGVPVTDDMGFITNATTTVASTTGTTVTIANSAGTVTFAHGVRDSFTFYRQVTGDVTAGSSVIANASALPAVGAVTTNSLFFPGGTAVVSTALPYLVLSAAPSANETADVLTFASAIVLSLPPIASGASVPLTITGAALQQVAGGTMLAPAAGQFSLTPSGLYGFNAGDNGRTVIITAVPDANPADVVRDLLTNPSYGLTQFPAANLGDLALYRSYCQAAGLWVSPVLVTQSGADSFLKDLLEQTNSEFVWSGSTLTIVPYGDEAITANGAAYTPPSQPVYALDDDDFLPNQATNAASVSASESPDPVTVTRLRPSDQINDIQLEYLDRTNLYNPAVVEVQDDAGIASFGLKSSGSKQAHNFCDRTAALASANLQLGRQYVRNLYSFTLDRKYVALDPMDIVAITDAGLGLENQWVRIREITENDDRSLSIVAEEYLQGTGATPAYGHQVGLGTSPNHNLSAGNAVAPIIIDVPVQLVQVLGVESWLATAGSLSFGGAEIWVSSDDVSFRYAGSLTGSSTMGVTTATFPNGSDPDTTNTLSVDLTQSEGFLLPGTQADADNANTVAYVCNTDGSNGEFIAYEQATLTGQYTYNLGTNGATAGYLRRGVFGSPIASHPSGSLFVRLRAGSLFQLPYDKSQIGNTIYVKLLSFNIYGAGAQSLEDVSSVSHVIGGAAPALSNVGALALYSDLSPGAATVQQTSNTPGPTSISGDVTLGSVTVTTIGEPVQLAFNSLVTNDTVSSATFSYGLSRGVTSLYGSGNVALASSTTIGVAGQYVDAPAAGTWTYNFTAGTTVNTFQAVNSDLSATEIRR